MLSSLKYERVGVARNNLEYERYRKKSLGWEDFPLHYQGSFPVLILRLKVESSYEKRHCIYMFIEAEDIKNMIGLL